MGNQGILKVSDAVKSGELIFFGSLIAYAISDSTPEGMVHVLFGGGLPMEKDSVELSCGSKAFFDTEKKKIVQAESGKTKLVGIVLQDASAEDERVSVLLVQKV